MTRILGISGSLRGGSYNALLLRAAAEGLPAGAELEPWHGLREIPAFDEDLDREPAPAAVAAFRDAVAAADAVLFATPEYNHSIPGALKNALDWASRPLATNPFRDKPVAVIGSSTGLFGAVWSQAELRKVLGAMGARVLDAELAVGHARDRFDADGRLVDDDARSALDAIATALLAETRAPLAVAA